MGKNPKSGKGRGNKSNTKSGKGREKKNNNNIGNERGNKKNTKSGKGKGKKNNDNIKKERKKKNKIPKSAQKNNQKQNKKVKPQRKSGKKQPAGDGRLACSRAVNSTCLDTAVKLLKIVTSRITNFLVQQKRMTKYNTTGGKKSGKKGLSGPIASKVIDVG